MKKIIFITPHLSTGGLPQYLLKKIEILCNYYDVFLFEWADITGGQFIVQREQLKNLLREKFIEINTNEKIFFDKILEINPDMVHLEEMPEYFLPVEVAKKIYKKDRTYSLIETTHDSSFNISKKLFIPDKFHFISKFSVEQFKPLGIPSDVFEYPIEKHPKFNLHKTNPLQLDPNVFHILNVGLWTPRKNQKEIVEYAKKLVDYKDMQFHFVGNFADNFRFYWEEAIKNASSNCKFWGERKDVHNFYASADLFLFTSRGTITDKETNPLVIKEALSYDLNLLLYSLPVYQNKYDFNSKIEYLDFNDNEKNLNLILNKYKEFKNQNILPLENITTIPKTDESIKSGIVISTYPKTKAQESILFQCVESLSDISNEKIICTHYPIHDPKIYDVCDAVIFDKKNIKVRHDFYKYFFFEDTNFKIKLNIDNFDNDIYHGPAVLNNYINGASYLKNAGNEFGHFINYDYIISEKDLSVFRKIEEKVKNENKKGFFILRNNLEGPGLQTVYFYINLEYFCNRFDLIKNPEQYQKIVSDCTSESNGLENLFYNFLRTDLDEFVLEVQKTEIDLFPNSKINFFSQADYFSIISDEVDEKSCYVFIRNADLQQEKHYDLLFKKDNEIFFNEKITINQNAMFLYKFTFEKGVYEFNKSEETIQNRIEESKIIVTDIEQIKKSGSIEIKNNNQ